MNQSNKYALVTGASSGIGWHISIELANRGYNIVAVSNQPDKLAALKKLLSNIKVVVFSTDLSDPVAPRQVSEFCESNKLEIEVLVNNAGMLVIGEAVDMEFEKAKRILQLHMNTLALLCRLLGRKMVERGEGYILNISSISAAMSYPTISYYGPTKRFVRSFTRAIRSELRTEGVSVTCVLPGAVNTAFYDQSNVNIVLAKRLRVMHSPERVARAGVNALFNNKAECIPGFMNRVTMLVVPLVPHFIIGWIHRYRKKKIRNKS